MTAFVTGNATIEYNGSTTLPGGIDISALIAAGDVTFDSMLSNGGTAVLQWTYHPANANLDFLHAGDVLKIKFVAEVSDGHGHTGSQPLTVTLVGAANASTVSAAGPVIGTDAFTVTELGNGVTKISGLHVGDSRRQRIDRHIHGIGGNRRRGKQRNPVDRLGLPRAPRGSMRR